MQTSDPIWKTRVNGIIAALPVFFTNNVMVEVACESNGKCDNDQYSFKAYLSRWMAATTQLAPFTYDAIMPYLQASAQAAAAQCSGGTDGTTCGFKWTMGSTWDGTYGPGQQMDAMQIIAANLIGNTSPPVTNTTGGTSQGDYNAGTTSTANPTINTYGSVTTGSKAGAGILTAFVLTGILGGAWWMIA